MPADIVNLRQARKHRQRAEKQRRAEENRVAFGQTKAERKARKSEADGKARALDGHRLDGRTCDSGQAGESARRSDPPQDEPA